MALTDKFVSNVKHKGAPTGEKHTDGGGMFLLVTSAGKYWRLNYRYLGKQKTLALGVYPVITLKAARERRDVARRQLANGVDPSQAKREEKLAQARKAVNTFEAVAREWLTKTSAKRAATTQEKVTRWLEKDIFPALGRIAISEIGSFDVLTAIRRIEARGAIDSAHRIKQVCGQVFRYAVASKFAERDVTADLRGALASAPKTNYAAITEPIKVGALLRAIHGYDGHPYACAALKLAPLLFVRPGELRGAEWAEIDLQNREWRIPGHKMKMGREHIVPLSLQAMGILQDLQALTGRYRYVFPSVRTLDRCMSENTLNAALRSLGYGAGTMSAHGFRATARTILDEVLDERVDLIEHQLAHLVRDVNGRAYNRTAHLPARRAMMQRWSDYLDKLRFTLSTPTD